MVSPVNNQSPLDAIARLAGAVTGEAGRALGEFGQHAVQDINSVGKAIEHGGLVGGAVQFLDFVSVGHQIANIADALTGPGALDPRVKEGISGAANLVAGNPMFLKDLFDLAGSLSSKSSKSSTSPAPSASQAAPRPDRDAPPPAPVEAPRSGYADSPAPSRSVVEVRVVVSEGVADVSSLWKALQQARESDVVKAQHPAIHAVLNDPNATLCDVSLVVTADVLRAHPEVWQDAAVKPWVDAARAEEAHAPASPTRTTTTPPNAVSDDAVSPAGQQSLGALQQVGGLLGMGMQFLGGLLSNPLFANVIAPLLTQALNLVVPGLGAALAPLLPTLLPMAGQLLSGGGAMLAGGGSAGGLSIDGLGSLLSTVSGAFAAPTGAPAAAPAPRAA